MDEIGIAGCVTEPVFILAVESNILPLVYRFYKLSEEDGEVSTGGKILARKEEGKLT